MSTNYLTLPEFHNKILDKKSKKKELSSFFKDMDKQYLIPSFNEYQPEKCPEEYPDFYIVNESKQRFKNEIKNSHFLAHWNDLCKYPEVASKLRFIYNLINLKKDKLINILDQITKKSIILEHHHNKDMSHILQFLGLNNKDISRIKIINKSSYAKNKSQVVIQNTNNNNNTNNNSHNANDFTITIPTDNTATTSTNNKMLINLSLIINMDEEYPRNLLACPAEKVIVGERHKKFKKKVYNFMCHKDNMIERLKTNKLCLSIWLLKLHKKTEWVTSLKMGTSYLSDTFPGEKGTLNDFIKEILHLEHNQDAMKYLNKLDEGIKNNYFYALEASNNILHSNKKNKKNTHKYKLKK
jgi:hypothetical protein